MPPGTLGVQLCLNIQFVQYYMGILYFLDYFLRITSATVISVHAKAHSLLREIFLQVLWFSLLVFPFPFSLNISRFQFNQEWQTKNQNVDVPPLNHYLFSMVRLNLRKAYLALLSYLCTGMSSVQRM